VIDLEGRWSDHTISFLPSEKYMAIVDLNIEKVARDARRHAAIMEHMRIIDGEPEPAVERTPQEKARAMQLARKRIHEETKLRWSLILRMRKWNRQ
jgi:hypothetical protein